MQYGRTIVYLRVILINVNLCFKLLIFLLYHEDIISYHVVKISLFKYKINLKK